MTIRSTFKTSTHLAATLVASVALLAAAGSAQAGNGRGFSQSQIARIPTGPNKFLPPRLCAHFPHTGRVLWCPAARDIGTTLTIRN